MSSKMYPEGSGGIKSRYDAGVLVLQDASGNEVIRYDPANKKVIIPAGATLVLNSGSLMQVGSGGVPTADPTNAGQVWADSGTLKVSTGS